MTISAIRSCLERSTGSADSGISTVVASERGGRSRRQPEHLGLHFHVGRRRDGNLHHFAPRLFLGFRTLADALDRPPQAGQRNQADHDQRGENHDRRLESS